jgi:3-oxoacyl-[acyl-carrier protein] reductase
MQLQDLAPPVERYLTTQFITAGAAARRMTHRGSGAILALTANASSEGFANVGGFGLSCAAIEAFCRQLASEVGPRGVRVVCLRSAGSPEAPGVDEVFEKHARALGISRAEFQKSAESTRFLRRHPTPSEIGNVAALAASDLASPVTGCDRGGVWALTATALVE